MLEKVGAGIVSIQHMVSYNIGVLQKAHLSENQMDSSLTSQSCGCM